jgi:hypothetical protein
MLDGPNKIEESKIKPEIIHGRIGRKKYTLCVGYSDGFVQFHGGEPNEELLREVVDRHNLPELVKVNGDANGIYHFQFMMQHDIFGPPSEPCRYRVKKVEYDPYI